MPLGLETVYDGQQFLIVDLSISFCRGELPRHERYGVPLVILEKLRGDAGNGKVRPIGLQPDGPLRLEMTHNQRRTKSIFQLVKCRLSLGCPRQRDRASALSGSRYAGVVA